jgi:hypothetical protein
VRRASACQQQQQGGRVYEADRCLRLFWTWKLFWFSVTTLVLANYGRVLLPLLLSLGGGLHYLDSVVHHVPNASSEHVVEFFFGYGFGIRLFVKVSTTRHRMLTGVLARAIP